MAYKEHSAWPHVDFGLYDLLQSLQQYCGDCFSFFQKLYEIKAIVTETDFPFFGALSPTPFGLFTLFDVENDGEYSFNVESNASFLFY